MVYALQDMTLARGSVRRRLRRGEGGFTLIEVAISLLVLSVAVLSIALAYPMGIKAQRLSRFQLFAATKVLDVMDIWGQGEMDQPSRQSEFAELCASPVMRRPCDLDKVMDRNGIGLFPVPPTIARRIDSDNDEIQRIIDEGGSIYYTDPKPAEMGWFQRVYRNSHTGNEIYMQASYEDLMRPYDAKLAVMGQTLVFGVVGYPQQNALPHHPIQAFPYYDAYPNGPQFYEYWTWNLILANGWPKGYLTDYYGTKEAYSIYHTWNGSYAPFKYLWMCRPSNYGNVYRPTVLADDLAYLDLAVDLVKAICTVADYDTMRVGSEDLPVPKLPQALPSAPWKLPHEAGVSEQVFPKPYKILAYKWLADAAAMCTYPKFDVPSNPDYDDSCTYAQRCHEAALQWAMRYCAANPYDWGAERAVNRQACFDYPLLQHDLFPTGTKSAPTGLYPPVPGHQSRRPYRLEHRTVVLPDQSLLGRPCALQPLREVRSQRALPPDRLLGRRLARLRGFRVRSVCADGRRVLVRPL
jgi:hypothetical protein